MIVDFQHHFTPHELMPKDLGRRKIVSYDEHGAPSFILHWMLFDLDEHIRMMDVAGIDAAFLTSAAGMCADLDKSRLCNDKAKKAERDYPGRFIGAAHAHPLGGAEAFNELARCKHELGFPGVVITSETQRPVSRRSGVRAVLDRMREARPVRFRASCAQAQSDPAVRRLRHRALGRPRILAGHGDDPADQFRRVRPPPRPHGPYGASRRRSLGVLGRIRSYQDKDFWGTPGNARHGMKPKKDFDYYFTTTWCSTPPASAAPWAPLKAR